MDGYVYIVQDTQVYDYIKKMNEWKMLENNTMYTQSWNSFNYEKT